MRWYLIIGALIIATLLTACSVNANAGNSDAETATVKNEDLSVEEMPEFAFIVSETSDTGVGNVTYICKNGDILKLNDEELDENTFDERIEKHTKGGYKDNIKKTISQDEVVEHYKTFLKLFEEKGNKMLEYPMALPDVVSSRCNWYGVCYSQGKVETVLLHAYDRMTNISSDDEKVNELYKWIEKVR